MSDADLERFGFRGRAGASLIKKLMQIPKEDKKGDAPIIDPSAEKGWVCQADLLYLTHDNTGRGIYKYALIVCDVGSRKCDGEPLKSRNTQVIIDAFKTIFRRGHVTLPKALLQTDSGSEFTSKFVRKYFEDHGVYLRYGRINRHRQQSVVEAYNFVIGRAVATNQNRIEIETGQPYHKWVKDLPIIISIINKKVEQKKMRTKRKETISCDKNCGILEIATKVRVILDRPRQAFDQNVGLGGRFRAGDIRWEREESVIEDIVLRPYQPPMYRVSGHPNVQYTKQQLQVV